MNVHNNTFESIDKQKLLDTIRSIIKETESDKIGFGDGHIGTLSGLALAENISSNFSCLDAVKVIRCNSCKYYTKVKRIHRCGLTNYTIRSNDYCSYAEENIEE